jgi:hypothetical protein
MNRINIDRMNLKKKCLNETNMNRIGIYVLLLLSIQLLETNLVSAVEIQDACTSRGYNHTISSWTWDSTAYIEVNSTIGYDINLNGTARKAYWTSNNNIDAVVYKSGTRTYELEGGLNNTVPKTTTSNDIIFIVFCNNNMIEPAGQVPEFSLLSACIALIGTIVIAANIRIRKK